MNKKPLYSLNPSGLPQILPTSPRRLKNIMSQASKMPEHKQFLLPFDDMRYSGTTIRNCITVWTDADSQDISALLFYELSPAGFHFIYAHTAKLKGYESVNDDNSNPVNNGICDFVDIPNKIIAEYFNGYVHNMIEDCKKILKSTPFGSVDRNGKNRRATIIKTLKKLRNCSTKDFTVDIYIPKKSCDITGERYFRPGEFEYNSRFNNPQLDTDLKAPKAFLKELKDTLEIEMPKHNIITHLETHEKMLKTHGKSKRKRAKPTLARHFARPMIDINHVPEPRRVLRQDIIPKHLLT